MNPDLSAAFAAGQLVRPSPHQPCLIHLVRALATLTGVADFDRSPPVNQFLDLIGPAEHLVFILLDGVGMNILADLPPGSFLATHRKAVIQAASPSTTASALTSVATGHWPAQHAITGWFTHLPEFNLTSTILPFTERFSQQSLTVRNIRPDEVLPLHAFYPKMKHRPVTLMPMPILNTTYAVYSRGGTPGLGYVKFAHAIDQMINHVRSADGPTHTHLYFPDIDSYCHKKGVHHDSVRELAALVDAQIARLAAALAGRARIVITADHGLIDINPEHHHPLLDGDPLLELLHAPPSGDARMPFFHVRRQHREKFIDLFQGRFGADFALLDIDEAERLEFFGPAPMSKIARRRFGDFAGIALRPSTLLYHPPRRPTEPTREPYVAQHAGLSHAEMDVPLIIA